MMDSQKWARSCIFFKKYKLKSTTLFNIYFDRTVIATCEAFGKHPAAASIRQIHFVFIDNHLMFLNRLHRSLVIEIQ